MGYYSNAGQHMASVEQSAVNTTVGLVKKAIGLDKSKEMYNKALGEMNKKTNIMNQQLLDFKKRRETIFNFPTIEGGITNG